MDINQVFGQGGLLSRYFEDYVPRPGQLELAQAVDEAIGNKEHLLVEAPTGTGKSIGYSVPAIYHAAQRGKRILLVTSSITLQEQLVEKDLPLLADLLPWDFTSALLKGRNNYLCYNKFYQEEAQGTLDYLEEPEDVTKLQTIISWARRTKLGDVSELPFEPPYRLWRRFSTTSEECKKNDCSFREDCCGYKARAAAKEADLVVCNYHLLFAHLQVRENTEQDLILPPFEVAILDEAHKAADIARDFFGFRLTQGSYRSVLRLLLHLGEKSFHEQVMREAEQLFTLLAKHRKSPAYRIRLRTPDIVPWEDLVCLLGEVRTVYNEAATTTSETDLRAELKHAAVRCYRLATQLQAALTLADPAMVTFLEEDTRKNLVLCAKPISVAERLRQNLFDATDTVIATSATLSTGGSFEHLREELGIPACRELVVDSPFDFLQQALLVVPEDLPEPNDPAFPATVANIFADILELAEGRTLGLFTSYRNLNAVYERIRSCGYRVLRQGDLPRTALVEEFRKDVSSVLLGTESFWTGIDVPGQTLSCVVIDRLPFPSPEDPVLDAISERDRQWFTHYSLPRAVLAFKQGFGRLIRSTADHGVVVVLDRRLISKPYGRVFTASLPPILKSRHLANVRCFLEGGA